MVGHVNCCCCYHTFRGSLLVVVERHLPFEAHLRIGVVVRHCYCIPEIVHTWTEEDQLAEERIDQEDQEVDSFDVVEAPFASLAVDAVETMHSCYQDAEKVVAVAAVVDYRACRPCDEADTIDVHEVVGLRSGVVAIALQEDAVLDQSEICRVEMNRCDRQSHLFFHDDYRVSPIDKKVDAGSAREGAIDKQYNVAATNLSFLVIHLFLTSHVAIQNSHKVTSKVSNLPSFNTGKLVNRS